jgi:1-acyl-sn-glycerol-3-phosphate acyltransferase
VVPIAHNAGYCWPPKQYIKRSGLITVVIGDSVPTVGARADELTDDLEGWIRQTVDSLEVPKN